MQIIAFSAQGWINSILFIFLSPKLRKKLFIHPFKRNVRCGMNRVRTTNDSNDSATAPLLGVTENTPSTGARAQQEDITYYSIPTEFP